MEALPCSAVVYRAMSRKDWIDQTAHRVLPGAFFRRPPAADGSGLSVDVESPSSCHKSLNKCHGVVSLHVGRVRNLRLEVVVDESPHANITGVPRQQDDRDEAEHLASELAKQARIVPPDQYLDSA